MCDRYKTPHTRYNVIWKKPIVKKNSLHLLTWTAAQDVGTRGPRPERPTLFQNRDSPRSLGVTSSVPLRTDGRACVPLSPTPAPIARKGRAGFRAVSGPEG